MPSRFDTDESDALLVRELWDALDAALTEVLHVLRSDVMPRFVRSPQFERYKLDYTTGGALQGALRHASSRSAAVV